MAIVNHNVEGTCYPRIICDHCGKLIDGAVDQVDIILEETEDSAITKTHHVHRSKHCSRAMEIALGDRYEGMNHGHHHFANLMGNLKVDGEKLTELQGTRRFF